MNSKKKIKFCVISRQRSGSVYLIDLLNQHQEIIADRELFISERKMNIDIKGRLPRFFEYRNSCKSEKVKCTVTHYFSLIHKLTHEYHHFGFKVMYNQIIKHPIILFELLKNNYRIIHLIRINHLDVIVSNLIKERAGIGHVKKTVSSEPIYIDPLKLKNKLMFEELRFKFFRILISLLPLRKKIVSYNEITGTNKDVYIKDIFHLLEVKEPDIAVSSDYKKLNNKKLEEKIINYQEIVKVLKNTRFEKLLN